MTINCRVNIFPQKAGMMRKNGSNSRGGVMRKLQSIVI